MRNILTIDVEEYFHAENVRAAWGPAEWENMPRRSPALVERILGAVREEGVKGTFFVLGWLAEREPGLVRQIASEGHEIGCHGYGHRMVGRMQPQEFRDDLLRATEVLTGLAGRQPTCFRAATFSMTNESLWALDILKECGYRADSSIYPVRRRLYGMPGAPRQPHLHASGIREFPLSAVDLMGRAVPVSGGGFFRFWPLSFTTWAVRQINREGRPYVFYMHPWETDTAEPRARGLTGLQGFQHYCNRRGTLGRFRYLLRRFEWCPVRDAEAADGESAG